MLFLLPLAEYVASTLLVAWSAQSPASIGGKTHPVITSALVRPPQALPSIEVTPGATPSFLLVQYGVPPPGETHSFWSPETAEM